MLIMSLTGLMTSSREPGPLETADSGVSREPGRRTPAQASNHAAPACGEGLVWPTIRPQYFRVRGFTCIYSWNLQVTHTENSALFMYRNWPHDKSTANRKEQRHYLPIGVCICALQNFCRHYVYMLYIESPSTNQHDHLRDHGFQYT
jgi:hypothetical protein